ncbi:MAG: Ig-like domain-containing protein [Oscillospiraceae bacterium]|nr:Ig-like domain-containing protein [Oscillospiraceae bacterium]
MRFKKLLSALLAGSMTATALLGAGAMPAAAEGEILTFDFQSNGSNEVVISAEQIAEGDVAVPVNIYIPENPGVYAINLKLQINDGQVAEDGSFGNYGLYLADGKISETFCFDSAHEGASASSFVSDFNASQMNVEWLYTMDPTKNADSAAEAGTTAWTADASWAYDAPFAEASLIVPEGTPAGTYVLDIRRDPYVNALSIGKDNPKYSESYCASGTADGDLAYQSKPLTIVVAEETTTTTSTTTTETTTTTTETTTTTTETTTTTTETTTAQNEPYIEAECPEIPALAPGETYSFKVKLTAVNTKIGSISNGGFGKIKTMTFDWADYDFGEEGTDSAEITLTVEIDAEAAAGTETFNFASLADFVRDVNNHAFSSSQIHSNTVSLTIQAATTTTTETTTTETVTTTTTTETEPVTQTTTVTTETVPVGEPWVDDYKIEGGGHYLIIGDVSGKPGESVRVPVKVYGDPGTAAMRLYFQAGGDAKITDFRSVKNNYAYLVEMETNAEADPANIVFASSQNMFADDGSIIVNIVVTIPEDAEPGTTYPIRFYHDTVEDDAGKMKQLEVANYDMQWLYPDFYDGSVTVAGDTSAPYLNYTSYILPNAGNTVNLTLFNAYGDVTWSSSDESVATVDQNGFVVAQKLGAAVITAANNGKEYTCSITVGLFGDVSMNGEISVDDAQLALQEYTVVLAKKPSVLNDTEKAIADVNGDGTVTVEDAQCILQYYTNILAQKTWITWYEVTGNPKAPGGPEA